VKVKKKSQTYNTKKDTIPLRTVFDYVIINKREEENVMLTTCEYFSAVAYSQASRAWGFATTGDVRN
jgi:hypothetical protein